MRALVERCDALGEAPSPRDLARLNMDLAQEPFAMTGNKPLREISERPYYLPTACG